MLQRTRSWWWFRMRSDLYLRQVGDHPRCRVGLPSPVGMAAGILLVAAWVCADETKHPVFVGSSECAKCHQGAGFGYQQCLMLLQAHSKAYATLALPEAKEIARLSGIPQEPQEAAICLGCHATGSDAEDWEKDDTFHLEDGVQCEKCHGAGSEYMDEEIMKDPAAARCRTADAAEERLHELPQNQRLTCRRAHGPEVRHRRGLGTPETPVSRELGDPG